MKLLFDQNLSPRLVGMLQDLYPESLHVRNIGLGDVGDDEVWAYAKDHDFSIVTKDADFPRLSVLHGHPPKVVWVRLGNCTVSEVESLLRKQYDNLLSFYQDEGRAFLELA